MSLGKDLASIRKSKNLTLEDVQNAIKIPHDILDSIEDDSIFSDPNRNKTYLRSFVRSYAKLLKIDDEDIVEALDEMEAGTYSGGILTDSTSEKPEIGIPDKTDASPSEEKAPEKKPSPPKKEIPKKPKSESPEISSINWADMGRKFSVAGKNTRIWISAIIVIVVLVLAAAGYFFWNDIGSVFESSEPEIAQQQTPNEDQSIPLPPTTADTTITETPAMENGSENIQEPQQQEGQNQPQQPSTLGDTLTVTLYAAFGQLEPVRVTSDLNWRTNPFWMEEGEAYNFDFSDTLLVRGQYSRLLLLFNGHVIENPRQNNFSSSFNSILLTREVLDQPRYLAPPPEEFPLEIGAPDSTIYRIRY
ncbi:MAG: hypothetical protein CL666_03390 [Balneola sp.]|nr:hypothetical protein [Balneola sp.]|tara:strand:- start:11692 stop:12774 length:1083 start_codon:yes stop_codon:yes gene_type:complete